MLELLRQLMEGVKTGKLLISLFTDGNVGGVAIGRGSRQFTGLLGGEAESWAIRGREGVGAS